MLKLKNLLIVISILIIIAIIFATIMINHNETAVLANGTTISNKKYGWGVKRAENHEQPDITVYKTILDKYNGISMGNSEKPYVYLTFDCGYEAGYTEKILEVLKQNDVKATFFITGHYLNSRPDLVQRMIEEGHIIGNHTADHICMPESTEEIKEDVMELHTALYDKFGYEMKYLRPPKGEYSETSVAYTNTLGYTTVMWSFAYDDWDENKQGREEYGKQKILDNVHNGEVMLLHSTSKDNSNILDYCIKEIKNMGYEFKSLDEFEK